MAASLTALTPTTLPGSQPRTSSPGTISIASDSTTGPNEGSNDNALNFDPSAGNLTFRAILGNFTSTTLGVGDRISLTFDFRFTSAPSLQRSLLRIGLFNSNGTIVNSDATTVDNDDFGYLSRFSSDSDTASDLTKVPSGDTSTAGTPLTEIANNAIGAFGTTSHAIRFDITNTATGTLVESYFDGGLISSATDLTANSPYVTFDNIRIGQGSGSTPFRIDNVGVETFVVPEPSSLALTALGALALVLRRRK